MLADSNEGKLYIVKGAPAGLRGETLIAHLTGMFGWKARWERGIGKTQHTAAHLVFAIEPPKQWAPRLCDPLSRERFPLTIDLYKKAPEHLKSYRPSMASPSDEDDDGFTTVGRQGKPKTAMHHLKMRTGGKWSDEGDASDNDGDSSELGSFAEPEPDTDDQEEADTQMRRQEVLRLRAEENDLLLSRRRSQTAPASQDVKMTKAPAAANDVPQKKPAWGRATAGIKEHPDIRERAGAAAASSEADKFAAGTAAEASAAAAPPTVTNTTPPTVTDTNAVSNTAASSAEEQSKQDEIIAEVRRQKQEQQQQPPRLCPLQTCRPRWTPQPRRPARVCLDAP